MSYIRKPLYIFDLDGTLALIGHRRWMLEGPKKDWAGFFVACVDDPPNVPVIRTLKRLRKSGADVWIFSGRSISVHALTVAWLVKEIGSGVSDSLTMRSEGDFRSDVEVKQEWLAGMSEEDRERLVAVFDDRQCVVDMWRANGVACFQVAQGDF